MRWDGLVATGRAVECGRAVVRVGRSGRGGKEAREWSGRREGSVTEGRSVAGGGGGRVSAGCGTTREGVQAHL